MTANWSIIRFLIIITPSHVPTYFLSDAIQAAVTAMNSTSFSISCCVGSYHMCMLFLLMLSNLETHDVASRYHCIANAPTSLERPLFRALLYEPAVGAAEYRPTMSCRRPWIYPMLLLNQRSYPLWIYTIPYVSTATFTPRALLRASVRELSWDKSSRDSLHPRRVSPRRSDRDFRVGCWAKGILSRSWNDITIHLSDESRFGVWVCTYESGSYASGLKFSLYECPMKWDEPKTSKVSWLC